jgi:hypothetical protein
MRVDDLDPQRAISARGLQPCRNVTQAGGCQRRYSVDRNHREGEESQMQTDGLDHVAVLTGDMDRFIQFYASGFEAEVATDHVEEGGLESELTVVNPDAVEGVYLGPGTPSVRFARDMPTLKTKWRINMLSWCE